MKSIIHRLFLAMIFLIFTAGTANAAFYEFEFWGEADPPGEGETLSYDGVVFGDNPEAHGRIVYDTDLNEVNLFWINIPTLSDGDYHFEDPTGYPGTYNPSSEPGGPINGDGDWFFIPGENLDLEFELYYEDGQWWGNYLIQDPSVQFSIGGQGARAIEPTVVPIPGAVWLLVSALTASVGLRRKSQC